VVNHARTLLLNISGTPPFLGETGDEIVDPSFVPLTLPSALQAIYTGIFGSMPDRLMRNYRAQQLLPLVHATPLHEYLVALDPRITYSLPPQTLFKTDWYPTVTTTQPAESITLAGESESSDARGQVLNRYFLEVQTTGTVKVTQLVTPFQQTFIDFTAGEYFTLPGSTRQCKLRSTAAPQSYSIDEYRQPQKDVSALVDGLTRLGEPVYNYLFGTASTEPYKTFRNLWTRKQELPLRLSGLLCAYVYRCEQLRLRGA
jgi:hypothetical protein